MCFLVAKKFNLSIHDVSKWTFKMKDNKGTPIPTEEFVGIVKTFHKSDFSLIVEYNCMVATKDLKIVTPLVSEIFYTFEIDNQNVNFKFQMIESYFWSKNAGQFLVKNVKLTVNQRTNIVNTIVDFMIQTFGINVTSVQKTLTAAAAVMLFPGLEFKGGESTVSERQYFSYLNSCRLLDCLKLFLFKNRIRFLEKKVGSQTV